MEELSPVVLARMVAEDFAAAHRGALTETMRADLANRIETGLRAAVRRAREAFVAQCTARAELWTSTEERPGVPPSLASEARARANEATWLADAVRAGAG